MHLANLGLQQISVNHKRSCFPHLIFAFAADSLNCIDQVFNYYDARCKGNGHKAKFMPECEKTVKCIFGLLKHICVNHKRASFPPSFDFLQNILTPFFFAFFACDFEVFLNFLLPVD